MTHLSLRGAAGQLVCRLEPGFNAGQPHIIATTDSLPTARVPAKQRAEAAR